MSFRRTAKAIVSRPGIEFDDWMETLRNQNEGAVPRDHIHRVAKTVLRKCDPKQYLLSHATIVASVDTYTPKGVKTGRSMTQGVQIDVRWPDFRIKPECHEIINNNGDAWERSLLLSTYRTFIGAHNYLEHIQLPDLSKGFIVDAIARDLGKSAYIDILVATDRKHRQLVTDIVSGDINAMSMGCFEAGTPVLMADGTTLPIEEIRPDMEVISQKGNICRVDNLQIRENRWSMRRVKVVGLPSIHATNNHKFYAVPRDIVQYDVRRGKKRLRPEAYGFEYREAGCLEIGDIVATPILKGEVVPSCTESEARLLGLWVGDGWKFENKHDSTVGVGFCLDASEEHASITNFVESEINRISWLAKEMRIAVGGSIPKTVSRSTRRGANYLVSSSRAVRGLVDRHVTGRRALDKCLERDVLLWPKKHQLAFLSGVIDSDGCISSTKRGTKQVFISTRNKGLATQFLTILNRCGLIGTLSSIPRKGTKMLPNSSGIDHQIRIRNSGSFIIPSEKIRKSGTSFEKRNSGNCDRWISKGHVYSVVKNIENSKLNGFVYDLQVDVDHSYVVNGVGVSNCISLFTICTCCGNVAADDSQLCPCVLYVGKGNKFSDEQGIEHPVAELIGHASIPNSNQFIEASWVRNPAFRGAVRRNILNPDSTQIAARLEEAEKVYKIRTDVPLPDGIKKAASSRTAQQDQGGQDQDLSQLFDQGDQDQGLDQGGQDQGGQDQGGQDQGGQDPSEPAGPKSDKIDEMLEKAQEQLLSIMVDKLGEKLEPKPEDVGTVAPAPSVLEGNDNFVRSSNEFDRRVQKLYPKVPLLHKWSSKAYRIVHEGGIKAVRASKMTPKDLIVLSWIEDRVYGRNYSSHLYKTAMKVGPMLNFPSETSFLAACKLRLGRDLSSNEENFLIWKGRIASVSNI